VNAGAVVVVAIMLFASAGPAVGPTFPGMDLTATHIIELVTATEQARQSDAVQATDAEIDAMQATATALIAEATQSAATP
jgi:hypothetical protein